MPSANIFIACSANDLYDSVTILELSIFWSIISEVCWNIVVNMCLWGNTILFGLVFHTSIHAQIIASIVDVFFRQIFTYRLYKQLSGLPIRRYVFSLEISSMLKRKISGYLLVFLLHAKSLILLSMRSTPHLPLL